MVADESQQMLQGAEEERPEERPGAPLRAGRMWLAAITVTVLGCSTLVAGAALWKPSGGPHGAQEPYKAVASARAFPLPRGLAPGRDLFDVNYFDEAEETPYSSDPEEAKAITTTCVIDTVQAAGYIGEAVQAIYRAEICPDDEPLGCTAPVAHAVTAIIWVLAFLTSATSTCADTINLGTSCAAAILRDLATAGSTIYGFDEDCFLTKPLNHLRVFQKPKFKPFKHEIHEFLSHGEDRRLLESPPVPQDLAARVALYRNKSAELQRHLKDTTSKRPDETHAALPNVLFDATARGLPRSVLDGTIAKIKTISRHQNAQTERNFALSNCVFDSVNGAGWLIRALLSINEASKSCDDPKKCVVDVLFVLGSLSYCAQMLSLTFVDCPTYGKREALCGADVTDVVGSMAIFVASILQAAEYCDAALR